MKKTEPILSEAKSLIRLATPIILALTLGCSMSVIDTVMSGQVSAQDLAAVSIGAAVWNLTFLTMTAILMALTPQLAKLFGEQKHSKIHDWIAGARWFAIGLAGVFYLAGYAGIGLINQLNSDPTTLALAANYVTYIFLGLPAAALLQVHKSLSESSGKTNHILLVTGLGVLLNIPLNYVFIYGITLTNGVELIPALGGAGCGLASALIFWMTFIGLVCIQKRDRQLVRKLALHQTTPETISSDHPHSGRTYSGRTLSFSWRRPNDFKTIARQLMWVGIPIGLAIFAEVSVFTYIPLVIAHLGEIQVASHQIALNVASLMFMIPLGLSQAITVRTGYRVGQKNLSLARTVSLTGIGMAFLFGICSMSIIMLYSNSIPTLYTDNEHVITLAAALLVLAAIFQLSDTVQITAAGALRGYQLTTVPMILTLIAFWVIAMPVGYILGLDSPIRANMENWISLPDPMGAKGFWIALISGLSANGVLQVAYLIYVQRTRFAVHSESGKSSQVTSPKKVTTPT